MGTKTISLDEEAYERLRAHKREDESFSAVVKRLAGERSWREVTGIWAGDDDLEEAVDAGRERSRERRERVRDELE
jgi:predicted CopG family antitoxin